MKYLIKLLFVPVLTLLMGHIAGAQTIKGIVSEADGNDTIPLPGVNVYWVENQAGTVTNINGKFEIKKQKQNHLLVFSFVSFGSDTIHVHDENKYHDVILEKNLELNEIVITERQTGSHISRLNPILTEKITSSELRKAACCNLSESFETNASVDVAYSDAVTGAKQIKLLGLAGTYTQFLRENIPVMRGLATSYGLEYIPGPWMESIYVSKGTASVKNGYESVTGQINLEYKKPENSEKLYFNAYANHLGKIEANVNTRLKINDHLKGIIMLHGENFNKKHDMNDDSFLDKPLQSQFNIYNKWKFDNHKGFRAQFGFNYLTEERKGGQVDFIQGMTREPSNPYGIKISTNRLELFSKTAYVFRRAATSMAYIQSFTYHDQNSFFGLNDYDAKEYNYYGNLMYQSYLGNTNHSYTVGVSFNYDRYDETLNDSSFLKTEEVPGGFIEYTFTLPEKLTMIAGLRTDFHNLYGTLVTPRLHVKYELNKHNVFRASAGKGYRSPNIIAENTYMLATSKRISFLDEPDVEEAWNFGLNYTRYIDIMGKELTINTEFYRTDFKNQIVLDRDTDVSQILIYNLNGESYSNSFQIESSYEFFEGFDLTAAFRYNDVKITINDELRQKPLVNRYKGLLSFSYAPGVRWQFDFTTQLNGDSRLPETDQLPVKYRKGEESPVYTILNAQITRNFRTWSVYIGGENLTNYMQDNPVIASDDPYGKYFDSSQIWGPLTGIKVYAGIRFAIED